MKRAILGLAIASLLAGALLLPAQSASADKTVVVNNYYGTQPFVYGGYSYLPIRNLQEALGAALLWDSLKNRAVITYNGHEMGLVVGSPVAYLDGAAVTLPVAPVIIHDRVFIPTTVVRRFSVPVEYDTRAHVVKIRGPKHWTAFSVNPRPSPTVVRVVKAAHPGKALGHSKGMSHPAKASPAKGKPAAKSSNKGKGKGHNK